MIRRLLIANRGEIGVRIARTCRRLGVETVAVYSDADRRAFHVEQADLAVRIGPAEPARSYLNSEAILDAARRTGADAIHPGYGFLAENAAFAEACGQADIVFVGPDPNAIRLMGSKERSRALAVELGVPVVPGYHGAASDDVSLAAEAERVGFPLLVKASAGGGGKGIRLVREAAGLADTIATARREAASAFGDSTLVLERFIERARHVEVQVFGDAHGRLVSLLDRECSIQRHHQKLVEEAPAPRLDDGTRRKIHEAALRVAAGIGYCSAGTVECLLDDATGELFFLEMNTRLQVEHPVTELVTGLDLVELQLRVASGEPLPDGLDAIRPNGVAIEARLCAERPAEGFLPSTGTVLRFEVPPLEGVRIDSGIRAGSEVGVSYDSMLAKLIAHGRDREEARRRLAAALRALELAGVESNADFLHAVIESEPFRTARVTTRFLENAFEHETPDPATEEIHRLAAAIGWTGALEEARQALPVPWSRLGPWRVTERSGRRSWTAVRLRDHCGEAVVRLAGVGGRYRCDLGSREVPVESWMGDDGALRLELDGVLHRRRIVIDGSTVWLASGGRRGALHVVSRDEVAAEEEASAGVDARSLVAPFPGLVTGVEVACGETVAAGSVLIVMESMKMVHTLRAEGAGVVRSIHCRPGETVPGGHLLVELM